MPNSLTWQLGLFAAGGRDRSEAEVEGLALGPAANQRPMTGNDQSSPTVSTTMGNRPNRNWLPWAIATAAVGVAAFQMGGNQPHRDPKPLIAERLQAIGELHLVAARYQGVIDHETSQEAADWAKPIPFADQLVRSATANHGLVEVSGRVDAGIDLKTASVVADEKAITVYLPEPVIYEPNVDATVHGQRSSLFYQDRNFGLKARRTAVAQMRASAQNPATLQLARDEATKIVRSLVGSVDDRPVVCVFGKSQS